MTAGFCRVLARLAARLVPPSDRVRWRDEWSAEMAQAWTDASRALTWGRRAELTWRAIGGLRHAAWLRMTRTEGWTMDGFRRDVVGALRFARRQPAFVTVAVLTLALGIGANTTIFSVVNAVFLRPLPVDSPATLVSMFTADTTYQGRLLPISFLNYEDYRDAHVLRDLAAEVRLDLTIGDNTTAPERVAAASVTANYFDVLGVRPIAGRVFAPGEDAPLEAHPIVVISSNLWRRRFDADPTIAGRLIRVNGLPYTIIGVAGDGFRGGTLLSTVDAWVPISQRHGIVGYLERWFDARQASMCAVYGRLDSPGDRDRVAAAIRGVSARLATTYPQQNHTRTAVLLPFNDAALNPNQRGQVLRMTWFLSIVVALVLALACTNVANLLLLRALGRRREMAVRMATGAGRGRLVRQLLTESLLLTLTGGGVGVGLAGLGRRLLWTFKPPSVPDTLAVPFDGHVLLCTLAVTAVTGIVFGLAPALQASRSDLVTALKGTTVTEPAGRRFPLKHALVVGQVAMSVLLLLGTGLVLRSLNAAQRIDPGVAADHLITLNMNPDSIGYDRPRAVAFFRRVIDAATALPGVRSAAFAFNKPLASSASALFYLEGKTVPSPHDGAPVVTNAADPRFFDTAGIRLVAGRNFTDRDDDTSTPSIIINQTLRQRYFAPGESPIGVHMRFVDVPTPFEIVGVVSDAAYVAIGEDTPNYYYYPFLQAYGAGEVTLYVRTDVAPQSLIEPIRRAVQALDPNLPLYNLGVVSDAVTTSLWVPRAAAALLGFFGAIGLALATVGTYGVMAFQVDQTRRDIGIRFALGASRREILLSVVGRGMTLVAIGLVVGVGVALASTRLIATFLYGLSPTDLLTFTAMPAGLALTALGATLIPARRATRLDPRQILRSE